MTFWACEEENPISQFTGIEVTSDYITLPAEGGSAEFTVTSEEDWTVKIDKDGSEWLSVDPTSGKAGVPVKVTVSAGMAATTRKASVTLASPSKSKIITVVQQGDPNAVSTCKDVMDGKDGTTYRVKGKVINIVNTSYGNFYINDGTVEGDDLYIYGVKNDKDQYPKDAEGGWESFGIEVGDIVTLKGPRKTYNGTVELVDAEIVSIEKGTSPVITCDAPSVNLSADETTAEFDIVVKNLTAKWTVTPAETYAWVKDYTREGTESGKITVTVEPNTGDEPRTAKFTVASTDARSVELTLTQNGNLVATTLAELIAGIPESGDGNYEANLAEPAVVTYVNGGTAYIEDATAAIILYLKDHGLVAGNTIKGKIKGVCCMYNGAPELKSLGDAYEKGEGEAPAPKEITIADLLANYAENLIRFVTIKGVTVTDGISDGDRNGAVKVGDDEIAVYAQLKESGLELSEGAEGNIIGIAGCYNENKQLLFWDNSWFTKTGGAPEIKAADIAGVPADGVTDATATVEFVDAEGWTASVTPDGTVVTAASIDGSTITYTVAANEGGAREGSIVVKLAKEGNDDVTKTIKVAQDGAVLPANIAELMAAIPESANASNKAVDLAVNFTEPATVSYVNGKTAYIEDATGAVILFMDNHNLQAGVTIKGKLTVKACWYQGMPELVGYTATEETVIGAGEIPLTEVTIAELEADYSKYLVRHVLLKDVTVSEGIEDGKRQGEVKQADGHAILVYAQLNNKGLVLTVGDQGNLTCIPALYNGNKQVYYWDNSWWESTATEPIPVITASDITNVAAAGVENATTRVTFTNAEGWTASVTPDGTVVTAAAIEGTTITYTVAANEGAAREGSIVVKLSKEGKDDVSKTVKVLQEAAVLPSTIAELMAVIPESANASNKAVDLAVNFTEPATVSYVNGKTAYIEDATGAVILFMDNHNLQAGVTIKGKLTVKACWYQGMPELVGYTATEETVIGAGEIPLTEVTIAELEADYSKYLVRHVLLKDVTVSEGIEDGKRQGEVKQADGHAILVYAQLNNKGLVLTVGDQGNLTCIPALYNGNKQVYYWDNSWWESTATEPIPVITASDITNVAAAGVENATTRVTFTNAEGWTASVTPDGTVVTAASIADATITYTVAANTAYEPKEGSIVVKLSKEGKDDVTKTIKVSQLAAEEPVDPNAYVFDFAAKGYSNGEAVSNVIVDPVSISFEKGSNSNAPKYYDTGSAIRCYAGNIITVAAPADKHIVKVKFFFASGEGTNAILANEGEFVSPEWTGSANPVIFTIDGTSGHRRIQKMVVTLDGGSSQPEGSGGEDLGGSEDVDPWK